MIDVCRTRQVVMVISAQAHWEPNWVEDEVRIGEGDIESVRQMVMDKILARLPGLGPEDRPDFYPSFHQSVWKWETVDAAGVGESKSAQPRLRDCVFESDVSTWRDAFHDVYTIVDRMDRIAEDQWYTTQAPTTTHRRAYDWAAAAFADEKVKLEQLIADLEALEGKAEGVKAPWTPGRMPKQ